MAGEEDTPHPQAGPNSGSQTPPTGGQQWPAPRHTCEPTHSRVVCRGLRGMSLKPPRKRDGQLGEHPCTGARQADAREGRPEATYQLVDAVDGAVVFVTEPLHAFKAEKARERRRSLQSSEQATGGLAGRSGGTAPAQAEPALAWWEGRGRRAPRRTTSGQEG